ncbi:hypothetical protein LO762_06225 [Actinocorallia sp. API 0066]|uniref:hypothetical protein n=1 Tax=Actinocorallia sp. API 0066 TaxID=2896846 RepID=UPI001E3383BF|nr:hypothetical protein [Actinocorallia sp. API 0066]MCD0448793.1 hypothetical protein [Actinocorallia sp. API 0066]
MSPSPGLPPAEAAEPESADLLEQRIAALRAEVRRAVGRGDRAGARVLRAELRRLEHAWDTAVMAPAAPAPQRMIPVRDQVHHALTLLGVPAAPKLILGVHEAFFSGALGSGQLTSLRRDEERSFRSGPHTRPFYLCAALTSDLLAPARGLLAVSTWPAATRMVGPLSPRVDFLTAAVRVTEQLERLDAEPGPAARRLLWRFAAGIPRATGAQGTVDLSAVRAAAHAELDVHRDADAEHRAEAAERAARQLDPVAQLFGARLQNTRALGLGS